MIVAGGGAYLTDRTPKRPITHEEPRGFGDNARWRPFQCHPPPRTDMGVFRSV
jgi:hypothetical protein